MGKIWVEKLVYISIFAFLINLFWEVSHSLLYETITDMVVREYVPRILQASIGDIIMVLIIFLGVSGINKSFNWRINNIKNVLLSIIFGIFIAVVFEFYAQYTNRFTYNPSMPVIPLVNVGLTPVLQIVITPLIVFFLAEKIIH